jgi:hypothetical protein
MTNYTQKGVTITGKYYRNLLRKLREELKKKATQNAAVEDFLNSQNETFYDQGIQQLMHRWGLTHIEFLAPVTLVSFG